MTDEPNDKAKSKHVDIDFKRINALIEEFELRVASANVAQTVRGPLSKAEINRLRGLIRKIDRMLEGREETK
jgi:hypothetical protein